MDGFSSSLWDRIIGDPDAELVDDGAARLTLVQVKHVIARDLEALLNTRVALPDDLLIGFSYCKRSIVNFGLTDFAQLCLTSSADRKEICDRLKTVIERHEPRLFNVRAQLVTQAGMVNRLSFVISAVLRANAESLPVNFDLMLEPSSLRYSIR